MGLQQWHIPGFVLDVPGVVRYLRELMGLLGRTPTWGDHRTVTTATTVVDSDDLVLVDTTSGSVTVTLPSAVGRRGRKFTMKKLIAANTMTLAGAGSETIDGAATVAITTRYAVRTVQSDGINWHIVAAHL
jgi:hypothetical protein